MAYKPTHKYTKEYRENDKNIKNIFKKYRKLHKLIQKLYFLDCCQCGEKTWYDNTENLLKETLGTKKYTGRDLTIYEQYEIISTYKKLLNEMN